ncbi:hypothetical protein J6590_106105, partial [Homalodisca vitripennis]
MGRLPLNVTIDVLLLILEACGLAYVHRKHVQQCPKGGETTVKPCGLAYVHRKHVQQCPKGGEITVKHCGLAYVHRKHVQQCPKGREITVKPWRIYTGTMFSSAPRVGRLPLYVTIDVLLLNLEACSLAYVHRKDVPQCPRGREINKPAAWPMYTGNMFSSAPRVGRLPLNVTIDVLLLILEACSLAYVHRNHVQQLPLYVTIDVLLFLLEGCGLAYVHRKHVQQCPKGREITNPADWPIYTGTKFSSAPRVGRLPLYVTIDVLLLNLEACSLAYVHRKDVPQCLNGGDITVKPWSMCTGSMFSSAPRVGRLPLNVTIDVLLLTLEACGLAYVHRKHVQQCPKGEEITVKPWPFCTGSMFSNSPRVGRLLLNVNTDVLLLTLEACNLAYVQRKHVRQCPKGGEITKPAARPICKGSKFSSAPRVGRLLLNVTTDVLLLTLEAFSLAYVHRKHVRQCPKGKEITVKPWPMCTGIMISSAPRVGRLPLIVTIDVLLLTLESCSLAYVHRKHVQQWPKVGETTAYVHRKHVQQCPKGRETTVKPWPTYTGSMFSSAPREGRKPLNVTIDVLLLILEACGLAYVHRKHVQQCPKGREINKPAAWPMYTGNMFSSTPRVGRLPLNVTIDVLLLILEACSLAYVHRKHVQQCPKGGEITVK